MTRSARRRDRLPQNADELDRLLASEPSLDPGRGFAREVMRAILREARTPPPIPFPWRRTGTVAAGGLLLILGLTLALQVAPAGTGAGVAADLLGPALALTKEIAAQVPATAIAQSSLAILAAYLLVCWSFRLAGSRD